jgi:hypothetical protein
MMTATDTTFALPLRRYSADDNRAECEEARGRKATYLVPFGPYRPNSMIPTGLAVDADDYETHDVVGVGQTVTMTGRFWLQVEGDYTEDGYESYEWELAEVVTENGITGWTPFHEITEQSFGGWHVEETA